MKIDKLEIENYKCFYELQLIEIKEGFNLFIGKNNSGKTTALELLDLPDTINNSHKSILNSPSYGDYAHKDSSYSFQISLTIPEIRRLWGNDFNIPLPIALTASQNISNITDQIKQQLHENPTVILRYRISSTGNKLSVVSHLGISPALEGGDTSAGINFKYLEIDSNNPNCNAANFMNVANTLLNISRIRASIYRFSALRSPQHRYNMHPSSELMRDAQNLSFCINFMQTNDAEGHKLLCSLINQIFPEVKWIQSTPIDSLFELRCLPRPREERRDDLAVPLNKMGAGIGNVIAILYVVLTSRFPQVIAIDEPNSFLHPKALRELLQILSTHGKQHQYILTGHSPDVLTSIEPSTISYFEINDSSSKIREVNKNQLNILRSELADLGIRMTDLHAKDRVLWVEGQTEEIVLPLLLRQFCPDISAGFAVLRVAHTGTFASKKVIVADIVNAYVRLTNTSLVPPMTAILLDKEKLTTSQIEQLTSISSSLNFLPTKMIENYVLHAEAIAAVLQNNNITAPLSSIEEIISAHIQQSGTLEEVDGASVLKEIFTNLSDSTLEFRKTKHTPELFEWALENKPEHFNDLRQFIKKLSSDQEQGNV